MTPIVIDNIMSFHAKNSWSELRDICFYGTCSRPGSDTVREATLQETSQ